MKQEILKQIEAKYTKALPKFAVGDTVAVSTIVREGDKKRTQIFRGIVLAIKGAGLSKTFTVRKISAGVGVEKIFPVNSPNISDLKIIKTGSVRRAKIFYMRKRIGKKALKIKDGVAVPVENTDQEVPVEDVAETPAE